MSQERIGLIWAALCALNGAFVPAVARLTSQGTDPLSVALFTTLFAAVAALLSLAVRGRLRELVRTDHVTSLVAVGTLGTTCAFLLFFAGAARSSAVEIVLCLQVEPAYSLVLAWVFLGHRPTPRRILATGLLLLGIALAVGSRGLSISSGIGLLLLTPICWQVSHLIVFRRLLGVSPEILTAARYVYGSAMLLALWLWRQGDGAPATLHQIFPLLPHLAVQGVILSYVGTLFWYGAVVRLDLARATAIVVPSVPLLSLAASFLLLGEVPSAAQWVGLVLAGSGVLAFVTSPGAGEARAAVPATAAGS